MPIGSAEIYPLLLGGGKVEHKQIKSFIALSGFSTTLALSFVTFPASAEIYNEGINQTGSYGSLNEDIEIYAPEKSGYSQSIDATRNKQIKVEGNNVTVVNEDKGGGGSFGARTSLKSATLDIIAKQNIQFNVSGTDKSTGPRGLYVNQSDHVNLIADQDIVFNITGNNLKDNADTFGIYTYGKGSEINLQSGNDIRFEVVTLNDTSAINDVAGVLNSGHVISLAAQNSLKIEAEGKNVNNAFGIWHNSQGTTSDETTSSTHLKGKDVEISASVFANKELSGQAQAAAIYLQGKNPQGPEDAPSLVEINGNTIKLSAELNGDAEYAGLGSAYGIYATTAPLKVETDTLSTGNDISTISISAKASVSDGNAYGIYNYASSDPLQTSIVNQNGATSITAEGKIGYGIALVNFNNAQINSKNSVQISSKKDNRIFGSTAGIVLNNNVAGLPANPPRETKISLESIEGSNYINSGRYGIYASGHTQTNLLAKNGQNSITGAIYAVTGTQEGSGLLNSVYLEAKTNRVHSSAIIPNAGDLNSDEKFENYNVISSLYGQGSETKITLNAKENYLSTVADSEVHTDLERVVWAYDGADINIDGFTSITTDSYEKSLNSIDIAIAAGTAVNLTEVIVNEDVADRAQVKINYANTTDSEGKAVLSSVTGDILSAYAGSVNIAPKSASDGLVVTGNLLAGNNGELTVDIGANGVLTGRADDYGDAGFIKDSEHTTFFDPAFSSEIFKGGQVNLKMGDNARWNVTGQSWITDISVADGAKNVLIDLVNDNTNRNSTAHALTVYNLKGNATFNMSLDGNRDVSDMLYIRNANGEYIVNVVDAVTVDDMYKGGLNGLRFATVGAGSKAKFRAFTYDKGALNVEYEVATDSYDNNPENDIYNGTEMSHEKPGSTVVDGLFGYEEGAVATLALNDEAATKAADGTISETTNFKLVDRKDATPSDSGKTIIDHARANYANAVQLDTLNKRQGEMRFSQGHEDGLWARIRHDDIGKRSSFRLDNTMVEVGVDSRYVKETGEFHTGVAFDYMNGDTDYHHISGEGDLDRYGVWFYTTWLGNEGDYTDFIIKCSLIDNEYKIYAPTTGEKITGDYDNNVISVSLEHGKKYSNEESWFIEPQAQLQYAYVTSAEYTNSQGTDVRLDGIHSLIGRVGVRAGKDVTRDNPFTFYARGDIMHEFMGKQDIKAKDTTGTMRVRYENDDTWYSAGLGMSYQHNKDKYYFLEAEKVFGGSNTSSYIVSGGVRFLFD